MTISDDALHRLQGILNQPDLSGTRYRIVRAAGSGGMGTVFEAEDTVLGRRVALKIVQPQEEVIDASSSQRLLDEAKILARLEHPGIVPVHDAGELPDGRLFYTMKFVEGQRLDAYARGAAASSDRLRVFQKICDAVAFAHARDVIHRDLKPENIMIGAFGEVLVLDWGVAKVLGGSSEPAGTIVGTPRYMAPEQAGGQGASVDKRADVFALGAILEFILAPTGLTKPLRKVCEKAQASAPGARYPSAEDLAMEVGRYLDGQPVEAHRENLIERMERIVVNNPMAFTLVAAYLVMRVLVFLFLRR